MKTRIVWTLFVALAVLGGIFGLCYFKGLEATAKLAELQLARA